MLGRRPKQATSLDADMKRRLPNNHFLRVDELIDWDPIKKRLEPLYDPSNGRPSYPPL